jgi:hypothetical protein
MGFDDGDLFRFKPGLTVGIAKEIRQRCRIGNDDGRAILVLEDRDACDHAINLITICNGRRQFLEENGTETFTSAVAVALGIELFVLPSWAEERISCPVLKSFGARHDVDAACEGCYAFTAEDGSTCCVDCDCRGGTCRIYGEAGTGPAEVVADLACYEGLEVACR